MNRLPSRARPRTRAALDAHATRTLPRRPTDRAGAARAGLLACVALAGVTVLGACDEGPCSGSSPCPDDKPFCGPSGACSDVPPPGAIPVGSGTPVDQAVDAGTAEELYDADAGPVVCVDDANEDNDTRATASPVTNGAPVAGRVCGEDDDWYALDAASGCSITATLTQSPSGAAGDIDMILFGPDGAIVGTASTPAGPEALNVTAAASGSYALRLRAGSRDDVAYELALAAVCEADLACPADDLAEDNDDLAGAASMTEGVAVDGVVCGADEDWYRVPVQIGCVADVRLTFEDARGDLDLHLLGPDGALRARSAGVTDEERIRRVVTEAGFGVRVFGFGGAVENTYRLVIQEVCAGQVSCPGDDPFEPNDDRYGGPGLYAGAAGAGGFDEVVGVVCASDDFFRYDLPAGCTVRGTLDFTHDAGDLDLELQRVVDGTIVERSLGVSNTEEVVFSDTAAAPLAFRVYGVGSASNAYRLQVVTECP